MDIQYYAVRDKKLIPFIDYYYTLKCSDHNSVIDYLAFPHLNTPVCFLNNTDVEFATTKTSYRISHEKKVTTIAWGMFTQPVEIEIFGVVDKICIVFKPLGLNHFIQNSFSEAIHKNGGRFLSWDSDGYQFLVLKIYSTNNDQFRIQHIEHFLNNQFREVDHEAILRTVISYLTDFEQDMTIDNICSLTNVAPRTLRRIFKKELGTSPIEFKKIARFRHSLNNNITPEESHFNLSKLGLNSKFYDQSHFIKVYQQMTGRNPSSFFRTIEKKANNNFILKVLK